jgi:thioesterase domain-containing protein
MSVEPLLAELEATIHHEIPISAAMGLRVAAYADGALTLHAPLAPNVNHTQTAFAGSLNAVVTLAGWGLVWLILRQAALDGQIVIQDSSIQYLRPVTSDVAATCRLSEPDQLNAFQTLLGRRGRARIGVAGEIREDGSIAVRFTGRYVVQRRPLHASQE